MREIIGGLISEPAQTRINTATIGPKGDLDQLGAMMVKMIALRILLTGRIEI